jgi:hypothetical protein
MTHIENTTCLHNQEFVVGSVEVSVCHHCKVTHARPAHERRFLTDKEIRRTIDLLRNMLESRS